LQRLEEKPLANRHFGMRCAEAMQAAAVGQMPPRRAARYLPPSRALPLLLNPDLKPGSRSGYLTVR